MNMNRVKIRKYRESDAAAVRNVCIETGSGHESPQVMKDMMLTAFCDYYIEQEPQNCFVLADENDQVVGYILCSDNALRWSEVFQRDYIDKKTDKKMKKFLTATCKTPVKHAQEYPAHLHIDILPQYQRMGLGTILMDALVNYLKSREVQGLMLSVAANNEKGVNFYKKYGFSVLEKSGHEIVMGLKLFYTYDIRSSR